MITQNNSLEGMNEPARQSWRRFFVTSNLLIERLETLLREQGVGTLSEFDTLYTLENGPPEGMTIRELSSNMTISHSGLSRLLDRLEKKGAIQRNAHAVDGRSVQIVLTTSGVQLLEEWWRAYSSTAQQLFGRVFSDEEHNQLSQFLAKLVVSLVTSREQETGHQFIHRFEELETSRKATD